MMNLRKTLAFSLLVALLFSFSACRSADEEVISDTQYDLLDTVCSISIYGMPEEDANKILKGAFALCRDYENILSRTVKGSDIYNVNHSNGELKLQKIHMNFYKKVYTMRSFLKESLM